MKIRAALVWIILGTGLACCTSPAMAQTYDPNYPVCLQVYKFGANYIDCVSPRCPNAKRRPRDGARHATSTHISHHAGGRCGGTDAAGFQPE